MSIATLIVSYPASADIAPRRIVAFSDAANSSKAAQAAGNTAALIGIADPLGAKTGGMVDVIRAGLAEVQLGGTVAAGDPLTADADGKAVKCVGAAGENRQVIAWADAPGVINDIIPCLVQRGAVQLSA